MPLYSDLYSNPSSSYTSFYLSGPYSNHSSIIASNYRSPFSKSIAPTPRAFSRSYIPHLSTITESQSISPLRRNFSPKYLLQHHSSPKYTAPKPIKINTADIDVSVNKYRKYDRKTIDIKKVPEKSKSPSPTNNSINTNKINDTPNTDNTGDLNEVNKGIRRDRPLVRLRTVHKKDSPRKLENDSAPKSWRQNFYADELNKVEDKKPKLSRGELLIEKFLIRTKEEEERLLHEGRRVPRKYTRKNSAPKKSADFQEICRVISSDTINEDLNPGIVEVSVEEDENNNNNTKRKKKAVRKKSNDKFLECENKSNLLRRPTQKKLRRQSVDSVVSDIVDDDAEKAYQEAIRDVSQVEVSEIQLPNTKIIATIDVQPSPTLKAFVDDVEIVESPKKLNKKFKFNVTVEEVTQFDTTNIESLPESKLDIGQGAIAIKRERSKSPKLQKSDEIVKGKVQSAQSIDGVKTKISPKLNKGVSGNILTELYQTDKQINRLKGVAKKNEKATPKLDNQIEELGEKNNVDVRTLDGEIKINGSKLESPTKTINIIKKEIPSPSLKTDLPKKNEESPKSKYPSTNSEIINKKEVNKTKVEDKIIISPKSKNLNDNTFDKETPCKLISPVKESIPTEVPPTIINSSKVESPSKVNIQPNNIQSIDSVVAKNLMKSETNIDTLVSKNKDTPNIPDSTIQKTPPLPVSKLNESPKSETNIATSLSKNKDIPNIPDSTIQKTPPTPVSKLNESPQPKQSNLTKVLESPKLIKSNELPSSPKLNKSKLSDPKIIKTPKSIQTPPKQEESQFPLFAKSKPQVKERKLAPKEENKSGENFWERIGTRESVYYDARKKIMQEKRKALFQNAFSEEIEDEVKNKTISPKNKIPEKLNQVQKKDLVIVKHEVASPKITTDVKKLNEKDIKVENVILKPKVEEISNDAPKVSEKLTDIKAESKIVTPEIIHDCTNTSPKVTNVLIKPLVEETSKVINDIPTNATKVPDTILNVKIRKPEEVSKKLESMILKDETNSKESINEKSESPKLINKIDTNIEKLNSNKLLQSTQESMTNEIKDSNTKQIIKKSADITSGPKQLIKTQQQPQPSKITIKTLIEPSHQNAVQSEVHNPVISGVDTTKTMSNKLIEENDRSKDNKVVKKLPVSKVEDNKKPLLKKKEEKLEANKNENSNEEIKVGKKALQNKKQEKLEVNNNTLDNSNEETKIGKKVVSKRSLINKSCIEDPDLQVFVLPKEAQEVKKEPSPPKFIPLQSNRISQFMHPYKKPEQYDECPVQIFARPKTIRHRHYPKSRGYIAPDVKEEVKPAPIGNDEDEEESEEEESSEEEATDDEDDSDDESSSDSVDLDELNDVWGYGKVGASTSSDDSGFDSSSFGNRKNKACDVNCHKKCKELTANLCGVNQKVFFEAIEAIRKKGCSERDSPTSNPAHNPAFALDPAELAEEISQSRTFVGFQKSGRITPPATTIPRFRKYNIEDFNFLKVLGKGSFGKVLLAELKDTEYYYAIKCLKKDVVLEDDDVECTLIERKVLALGTKHPYLCHLLCTFQTESHLFFVMEYLNGGDLMFHIQQSGKFPEPRARFYAAEIVSGLKFLHGKGIVYRDLKLDNILLDFDGHVRIADFGMCKLQIYLDRTADTFCGTPDYMAPEIIKGQHYNQNVDWWSFGVLVYEMMIGQSPFSGCDEDELFWSICNERPVLPRFLSKEASSILTLLLEKDANKRLGNKYCPHGDIEDQPFFQHIAWDLLNLRQLEPPFKPILQHPLDTQYFDRTFTVEKAKLTPIDKNILQSMDQAQFQGFSYTNPNATDR